MKVVSVTYVVRGIKVESVAVTNVKPCCQGGGDVALGVRRQQRSQRASRAGAAARSVTHR